MHQLRSRRTRAIGTALVLMFVATLSATCIAQAEMSTADMACCAEMASDCGAAMARQHECCQTARPDSQLGALSRLVLAAPSVTVIGLVAFAPPDNNVFSVTMLPWSSDSSPPGPTHHTHLVLSVFRI